MLLQGENSGAARGSRAALKIEARITRKRYRPPPDLGSLIPLLLIDLPPGVGLTMFGVMFKLHLALYPQCTQRTR